MPITPEQTRKLTSTWTPPIKRSLPLRRLPQITRLIILTILPEELVHVVTEQIHVLSDSIRLREPLERLLEIRKLIVEEEEIVDRSGPAQAASHRRIVVLSCPYQIQHRCHQLLLVCSIW